MTPTTIETERRGADSLHRMVRPLATNPIPANKQASKIFWKAPWWSKLAEEEKDIVANYEAAIEEKLLVEYGKPAPFDRNKVFQTEDKRGRRILFSDGAVGVVTGFHHEVMKLRNTGSDRTSTWYHNGNQYSATPKQRVPTSRTWWCLVNGEMRLINFRRTHSWKEVGNYTLTRKRSNESSSPTAGGGSGGAQPKDENEK